MTGLNHHATTAADSLALELERRFALQREYLGEDKQVNRIQPLVSVTVTTYQQAPYIAQCLDSILTQRTSFPFEIVVGEDGSTDGTREICMEYAERHPDRIRLFLRDRQLSNVVVGGRTRRLNGTWVSRSARGVYFARCEGDDYWIEPNKLQMQVDVLEGDSSIGLVHGEAHAYREATGQWIRFLHRTRGDLDDGGDLFQALIAVRYRVVTCTCMYRCALMRRVTQNPSHEYSCQHFPMGDTPLWLELARVSRFEYIDKPLGVYRVLDESMSRSRDPRKHLAFQLAMLWMRVHYMNAYPVPQEFRRRIIERRAKPLLAACARLGETTSVEELWDLLAEASVTIRPIDRFYRWCGSTRAGAMLARSVDRVARHMSLFRGRNVWQ